MNDNNSGQAASLPDNRTLPEVFTALNHEPDSLKPPEHRTAVLKRYLSEASPRVMRDSERGIDGEIIEEGGAEVWNVYEYAPWEFQSALTLVMGNLEFIDDHVGFDGADPNLAYVEVHPGAKLYVAGDLRVGSLFLLGGELHCGGTIHVQGSLVIAGTAYVAADCIRTKKLGSFGIINCSDLNFSERIGTETAALKLRLTNSEIIRLWEQEGELSSRAVFSR